MIENINNNLVTYGIFCVLIAFGLSISEIQITGIQLTIFFLVGAIFVITLSFGSEKK